MSIKKYLNKTEEMTVMTVRIDQKTLQKVKKYADKLDVTVTDIVKASFRKFIVEQEKK